MKWLSILLVTGLIILASLPKGSQVKSQSTFSGICFVLYQLADNNLEVDIRTDLSELTQSGIAQSASTVTWVYHDALNQGSPDYTGGPLADVYNADGTPITERFDGSRYLTWDHDLGKMVVDTTLSSEVNSDTPAVLQAFLEYAFTDCVTKGTTEFFLALSSHGSGFQGFGGDENIQRRGRKLSQANADLLSAIQGALGSVTGAPSMLDVLGFDACLMQSMDAIDDYANITKYYLASEAIEPGHGWAYNELSETTSSLDLALNVLDTFLTSVQNYGFHDTPKTMAVVDTAAYPAFRDAWDALCSAMADILASGNDPDFHASLMRARANTLSFEGILDQEGPPEINSAMDIGDFFAQFIQLCKPVESSELYTLLNNAYDAYFAQFVAADVGPGTSNGTGMHITWVSKKEYLTYEAWYVNDVFPTTGPLPLLGAPNYVRFLDAFYNTATPTENVGDSVCQTSSQSSRSPDTPTMLLIDPTLVILDDINTEVQSEITRNVDSVFVEYGIDVTSKLQDDGLRRRLDESARRQAARRLEDAAEGKKQPSSFGRHCQAMKWRYRENSDRTRRLQNDTDFETDDYFLILGGDVVVEYNGPSVVARWDSTFFWIQSGDALEPLYAFDDGGGRKSIPVCYFNQNNPVTSDLIPLGTTLDDAIADLGCEYGFLSFSSAEDSDGRVTLYVYRGNTLSSVPVTAGRNIVPILYIEYSVGDDVVYELLGGFNSLIVPWTPESNFSIYALSDYANLDAFGSDTAFLQIFAYDYDANITDGYFLPYTVEGNASDTSDGSDTGGTGGDVPTESSNSGIRTSLDVGTWCIITTLIFVGATLVVG